MRSAGARQRPELRHHRLGHYSGQGRGGIPAGLPRVRRSRPAAEAQRQIYQLEGDTEDFPELASNAEMIGTLVYHALGYNVVDTYIVNVDPRRITIAPKASARCERPSAVQKGGPRRDSDGWSRNPDGTNRMTASRFVEGTPLEGFNYFGTRPDDPNDIYPHEHRRELRAIACSPRG